MPIRRYIDRIRDFFIRHTLWLQLLEWSKKHSLPGLNRIPIYYVVKFILDESRDDALVTRANSMAFSFFVAIFPAIIVLITLLAYTPLYQQFDSFLHESIEEVMPGNAGQMLFETITNIATIPRGGLLSFGFFLAIWFASNGMLSMMRGLEKKYRATFKRRTPVEKRLIAIQLTFFLTLILMASIVFVILGGWILGLIFTYVHADWLTRMSAFALRWVAIFMLFYAGISTIYRYGSSTRRPIPFFNPGAMLATLLSIASSWGFSFYVDNFGSYNKVYGSIGTLIVLMVWLQLNCLIILIGFELNASIVVLREERRRQKEAQKAANPE